jgi:hypothetical protein
VQGASTQPYSLYVAGIDGGMIHGNKTNGEGSGGIHIEYMRRCSIHGNRGSGVSGQGLLIGNSGGYNTCTAETSNPADGTYVSMAGTDMTIRLSAPPTVTGSRGGNAALASLLSHLADLGLIIDGTS